MITINSNEEARRLIRNGVLVINDDLEINFDGFSIDADIKCKNIYSKGHRRNINCDNIHCNNINCDNIHCHDINCINIDCNNINCNNIDCNNIDCNYIKCRNIDCNDINCRNIDCNNIQYWAVVFAYSSFKCKSITGRKTNSKHFCLDGEIEYKNNKKETIKIGNREYNKREVEEALENIESIN